MSLLDHFENNLVASPTADGGKSIKLDMIDTAYKPTISNTSTHLAHFTLDRVQFTFPGIIITMALSNNFLAIAVEKEQLSILRIDLEKPDTLDDISWPSRTKNDKIRLLHYSATASHLIISCTSGDNYYLHSSWTVPRYMSRFKVFLIFIVREFVLHVWLGPTSKESALQDEF